MTDEKLEILRSYRWPMNLTGQDVDVFLCVSICVHRSVAIIIDSLGREMDRVYLFSLIHLVEAMATKPQPHTGYNIAR